MKGLTWGSGVFLASILVTQSVSAQSSFYIEGGIGFVSMSDFEDVANDGYPFAEPGVFVETSGGTINIAAPPMEADDYNVGGNVFVGINVFSFLAFEMGYLQFGDFSAQYHKTLAELDGNGNPIDFYNVQLRSRMKVSGFAVGARAAVPISKNWSLFGRLGIQEWRQSVSYSGSAVSVGTLGNTDSIRTSTESGFDPYLGFGASYEFDTRTSMYLELNSFSFGKDDFEMSTAGLFLGVRYVFADSGFGSSRSANEKRARENDTRAISACDPKYKDISGLACE